MSSNTKTINACFQNTRKRAVDINVKENFSKGGHQNIEIFTVQPGEEIIQHYTVKPCSTVAGQLDNYGEQIR